MTLDNPNLIKYGINNSPIALPHDKQTHMSRYDQGRHVQAQQSKQQPSPPVRTSSHRPERPKTLDTFSTSLSILKSSAVPISLPANEHSAGANPANHRLTTFSTAPDMNPKQQNAPRAAEPSPETNPAGDTFDEQEEWDKISEIMANFGTDDLSKSEFGSGGNAKSRSSYQKRFENGRSNSIAGYSFMDGNKVPRGPLQTSKSMSNSTAQHLAPTARDKLLEWLYTSGLEHLERVLYDGGFDDIEFIKDVIDDSDLELLEIQPDDRKKLKAAIDSHLQKPSRAVTKFVKPTTKSGIYSSFNTNEKNYVFNANNNDNLHSTKNKNNNYSTMPKQKQSDSSDATGDATLTVDEWLDSIKLPQYSEVFR